jgi:hypothetical protein
MLANLGSEKTFDSRGRSLMFPHRCLLSGNAGKGGCAKRTQFTNVYQGAPGLRNEDRVSPSDANIQTFLEHGLEVKAGEVMMAMPTR